MAKLIFNADDVRRVVEHSLAAPKQRIVAYSQITDPPDGVMPEAPAVILVHDQGVYLMSNGEPGDIVNADTPKAQSFCAYAQGCHPVADTEWWDTARALVGGDDFADTLPWARQIKEFLDAGAKKIVINFSEKQVTLSARYR